MRTTLIYFVQIAARIFTLAVWAYVILSWFAHSNAKVYKVYRFLGEIVEPLLGPFRRLLEPLSMRIGIDFSPYLLALAISFVSNIIVRLLY